MKVLFLDYDGVINKIGGSYSTATRPGKNGIIMSEPELVYRVNLIVDRTECEIVLSSSWRHFEDWREQMQESGIFRPMLDRTPLRGQSRGHEIQEWLDAHPEVTRYAILDDESDMLAGQAHSFFKTETAEGLTQEIADAVESHLMQ